MSDIQNLFKLATWLKCDDGSIVPDPFDPSKTVTVRDAKTFGHRPIVDGIETGKTITEYLDKWAVGSEQTDPANQLDFREEILALQGCGVPDGIRGDDLKRINPLALDYAYECDCQLGATLRLNQRFAFVAVGGKRFIHDDNNGTLHTKEAFVDLIAADKVTVVKIDKNKKETNKEEPTSKIWMAHHARRTYEGRAFYPAGRDGYGNKHDGPELNLWRGVIGTPKEGSAAVIQAHFENVLHNGNADTLAWGYAWYAQMLAEPWKKPHAHIVRFDESGGTGKGVIGRMFLDKIIGPAHSVKLNGIDDLTGKFTKDLETAIYVVGDEIAWGGNQKARDLLYSLTGDHKMKIEGKGVDRYGAENYLRLEMYSNSLRPVPVMPGDRRFAMFAMRPVSQMFSDGIESKECVAYYNALNAATSDPQSVGAFYKFLSRFPYQKYDLYRAPMTVEKLDVIERNLRKDQKWLLNIAREGGLALDGKLYPFHEDREAVIPASIVYAAAEPYFKDYETGRALETVMGGFFAPRRNEPESDRLAVKARRTSSVPRGSVGTDHDGEDTSGRIPCFVFPSLSKFRECAARRLGLPLDRLNGDKVRDAGEVFTDYEGTNVTAMPSRRKQG